MRCRACNCTIRISYNKYGMEDLCYRCRSMIPYEGEERFMVGETEATVSSSAKVYVLSDPEEEMEEYEILDRNHESLGILDETYE